MSQAVQELSVLPYEDLTFAKVDHHRDCGWVSRGHLRTRQDRRANCDYRRAGRPLGKSPDHSPPDEAFHAVRAKITDAVYNPVAHTIVVNRPENLDGPGVTVVTGGTADIPIAEEAAVTAELMGNQVERVFDVGVAGLHRVLDKVPPGYSEQESLVMVAGMEGALPSVVGGWVSRYRLSPSQPA